MAKTSTTGRRPKRASRSAAKTAKKPAAGSRAGAKTPSARRALVAVAPATLAAERRRLALKHEQQIRQRVRDYRAAMSELQKAARGRRPLGVAEGRPAAAVVTPLRILAECDSWFDYPPFEVFGRGGIIPRLARLAEVPILNLATAGDEVRYMLGVKERKQLIKHLTDGSPAGGRWDALFFSGGGNHIVDNPMALWVRDFDPSIPAAQLVNQARFDVALSLVRAGYEDLIALRDALSPETHLFFHGYDFAIPDGRGVCHLGPWLKPTFDLRGFPADRVAASAVVKEMLRQFADMLQNLEAAHSRVTVIKSQGTLQPTTSSWHNELHPSRDGFDLFAALFRDALKTQFPTRVP